MFDAGFGQKLFMSCLGEGRPTVILDAPTGATSDVWLPGQLLLSSVTLVRREMHNEMNVSVTIFVFQVCVYDRAGLGWSEPAPRREHSVPRPRVCGWLVTSTAWSPSPTAHPQEKPLVLVLAELGGLVARLYTHLHKEDVAHFVMIDPISETLFSDVSNLNDA